MKRMVSILSALILALPFAVFAESTVDYGTDLNIVIDPYISKGLGPAYIIGDPVIEIADYEEFVRAGCLRDLANSRRMPSWSPDGSKIVFTDSNHSALWMVSSAGGDPVLLDYEYRFQYFKFTWDDEAKLWGNGIDFSKLGFYKSEYQSPKFSPDGSKVLFVTTVFDSTRGSESIEYGYSVKRMGFIPSIESYDLATGEKKTVIAEGRDFDISRDGRYIVYRNFDSRIYTDSKSAAHNGALAVFDTVTGDKRILAEYHSIERYNSGGCIYPAISPDGSTVAYGYDNQIFSVPFIGGTPVQVSNFDNSKENLPVSSLSFSPDGQWLIGDRGSELFVIYVSDKTAFYTLSGDVYNQQFSTTNLNHHIMPAWSPDGTKICYTKSEEQRYEPSTSAGSYGEFLYIADFDPDRYATGKDTPILVETETPQAFGIAGNYPNPFNPATTIEFTLDVSAVATLDIYNTTGQIVRSLVDMTLGAGRHSVVWDGRNDAGTQVSSGAYIARLSSGGKVTSRQMMLMK